MLSSPEALLRWCCAWPALFVVLFERRQQGRHNLFQLSLSGRSNVPEHCSQVARVVCS